MIHIPLSVPNMKGNEKKYLCEAVDAQWVSTGGAFIERFEREFAAYAKAPAAAAVQSGTAALHLAMLAGGVGCGDVVLAPCLTFVAAVNPIMYAGAVPVFMDCDDSLCMDPCKLEDYLSKECELRDGLTYDIKLGKPVKAVVVVYVFGNGADMDVIMGLAKTYNLIVIEDACEAVGTFYTRGKFAGRMVGTIGDFGAYSFNGNKIITTGGGGMFVAREPAKVRFAKHISTQAKTDELYYDHDEIGYNYRMTNLQAALGLAQLEQLEGFVSLKEANYSRYHEMGVPLLQFASHIRPNYWFYSFMSKDRDGLIRHLAKNGIQARPIWKLVHTLPMYGRCRAYKIEKAVMYGRSVVNLPCGTSLSPADIGSVAECVREFEAGA